MRVILQPSLRGLSGSMGDWVYQYRNGKTVVGEKPVNNNESTEAQLAQQERFGDANAYAQEAMADPAKREFYETIGEERGIPAFSMAMGDYLKAPTFKPLDLSNYEGRVGDPIVIRAVDNVGLVSVEVAINTIDGTDIEKGMAMGSSARTGKWTYTATAPVALGSDIFIEVVGIDHAGKKVKMSENPIVGAED